MDNLCLSINAFGGCGISIYDKQNPEQIVTIAEHDGRSKKHWALIEYLLFSGKSAVPASELIELLWPEDGEDGGSNDPARALRLLVHRARNELNRLELCSGSDLIVLKSKSYSWARPIETTLDTEEFISLYRQSQSGTVTERLNCLLQGIDLYKGRFLPHTSATSHWAMTLDAYYHTCYISMCDNAITMLNAFGRYQDIINLCKKAVEIDPYFEHGHTSLMRAMSALGFYKDALNYYKSIADLMMEEFGISPSEEMASTYRSLVARVQSQHVDLEDLRSTLLFDDVPGAMYVSFETFQLLCQMKLRECKRSGQVMQLANLSFSLEMAQTLHTESDLVELLDSHIRCSLRQGDVFSHLNQQNTLVLLQSSTYEDGAVVIERILASFQKEADDPRATFQYSILPFVPQNLSSTGA